MPVLTMGACPLYDAAVRDLVEHGGGGLG